MQRKIYLSPYRRNFLMQQSLFNLFFFFRNYTFRIFIKNCISPDTKRILRKKNSSPWMESKFRPFELPPPQFDCPTRKQKYLVYYSPTTTQTLGIVSVRLLHVRNRILRNQPGVDNRLQRVPFFLVVAFDRLIIFCRRAREHRYNWSSVRDR